MKKGGDMSIKPQEYDKLSWQDRKDLREQYIEAQSGKCMYCKSSLLENPPASEH